MPTTEVTRIPMQIGTEVRIKASGELAVSNPETEIQPSEAAASAILTYYRDPQTGEHVIGLAKPLSFAPA